MAKTPRLPVPLPTEINRKLRQLAAANGRSLAANFLELAVAGATESDIARELADLKLQIKNQLSAPQNHAEILAEIRSVFARLREEFERLRSNSPAVNSAKGGVLLPEKAALLLFGEALFSSALATEILNAELPGTPPKPAAHHIRAARQKSQAALSNFMAACREEA